MMVLGHTLTNHPRQVSSVRLWCCAAACLFVSARGETGSSGVHFSILFVRRIIVRLRFVVVAQECGGCLYIIVIDVADIYLF